MGDSIGVFVGAVLLLMLHRVLLFISNSARFFKKNLNHI